MPVSGAQDMIVPNSATSAVENDALKAVIILHWPSACPGLGECWHDCSCEMQIALHKFRSCVLGYIAALLHFLLLCSAQLIAGFNGWHCGLNSSLGLPNMKRLLHRPARPSAVSPAGICSLKAKNPFLAWGQKRVSHDRRAWHKLIPAAPRVGAISRSAAAVGPTGA